MRGNLHADAHALTLFRVLAGERGRCYSAATFPREPHKGCAWFVNMAHCVGWLRPTVVGEDCYAVLDVLSEEGDVIQDYAVRDALAFQQIKRRLKLVVVSTDGDPVPANTGSGT